MSKKVKAIYHIVLKTSKNTTHHRMMRVVSGHSLGYFWDWCENTKKQVETEQKTGVVIIFSNILKP